MLLICSCFCLVIWKSIHNAKMLLWVFFSLSLRSRRRLAWSSQSGNILAALNTFSAVSGLAGQVTQIAGLLLQNYFSADFNLRGRI